LCPIGSAVLMFIAHKQTDRHPYKQIIYKMFSKNWS